MNFLEPEAHVIPPSLESETLKLQQVAPGRYEASFDTRDVGQYIANVVFQDETGRTNTQVTGLQVSYPPEYAELEPNSPLLTYMTEATGGQMEPEATATFAKRREGARKSTDIWPMLAALAILLFPIDVALRRLMIEREHWALFGEALARLMWWRRIPSSGPTPETAPTGRLLRRKADAREAYTEQVEDVTVARSRVTRRTASGGTPDPRTAAGRTPDPRTTAPRQAVRPTKSAQEQERGRMSRLLEAKKRAKKQ